MKSVNWRLLAILLLLFGLGLAIRLTDLNDLPLDFHPTRQLYGLIKARILYFDDLADVPAWQQDLLAAQRGAMPDIEPTLLEHLAALTYRLTGEQIWVGRAWSVLFWMIGGIFLYLLARRLSGTDGALVAVAVYLFLPYAISASRSFQPDPLMVALVIAAWWAAERWDRAGNWVWALLAGLLGGLAVLIKLTGLFFVAGGVAALVVARWLARERPPYLQIAALTGLTLLPGGAYNLYGLWTGTLTGQVSGRFIPALLIDPLHYLRWFAKLDLVLGALLLALALLGLVLADGRRTRTLLGGLWASYLLFGLVFNYHIASHDYYSLPVIPITALSLGALAAPLAAHVRELTRDRPWQRVGLTLILLFALGAQFYNVRADLRRIDYRPQAGFWAALGERLGPTTPVVALSEDYGYRLFYWGWVKAEVWPAAGDLAYRQLTGSGPEDFASLFDSLTDGKEYFLVTDMAEFARQPDLRAHLELNYPLAAQGDGFVLYDLHPEQP